MCGIFGIYNFNPNQLAKATRSLDLLTHRGPDQSGEWYNEKIYLGHKRLSIIDLSEKGKQPLTDNNSEIVLSMNGEIYNFQNLKNELQKDYEFKSKSDSEVIIYGYKKWGLSKLLTKIDGMYAFLLYDKTNQELYAVRDKFGKKPLFYAETNNQIIFSSEIKSIFEFDDELRSFSKTGIINWLYYRGNISGSTIYDKILNLAPGYYIKIKHGTINKIKYYDLIDNINNSISINEETNYLKQLEAKLDIAVSKRLISDVPVGIQLSGGIDSSLIAYFMRKHHTGKVHSFSIGFSHPDDQNFSEEKYATFVANKLGLTHHQINITQQNVLDEFEKTIYLTDGMLDIPNTIPIYLLSKYAKEYITVSLTGEGADEAFGGYTKFNLPLQLINNNNNKLKVSDFITNFLGSMPSAKIRSLARIFYLNKHYAGKPNDILKDLNCYISSSTLSKILNDNSDFYFTIDNIIKQLESFNFQKQMLLMDHKMYLLTLLERQDRASMGAGMESRLPFLDPDIVEWGLSLPVEILFNNNNNKIILKRLSEKIFGKDFTYRPKVGFPLPIYKWLDDKNGFYFYLDKIYKNDFILNEIINNSYLKDYLASKSFSNKLLCYPDEDRMWLKWFMMVLRTTQDLFRITDIK